MVLFAKTRITFLNRLSSYAKILNSAMKEAIQKQKDGTFGTRDELYLLGEE